jgi:hypothetical protein
LLYNNRESCLIYATIHDLECAFFTHGIMSLTMTYKIISPTGASVTKTFTEQEVAKIKSLQYFQVVPLTVRVYTGESVCTSCEG